jgi:hypothetical protein
MIWPEVIVTEKRLQALNTMLQLTVRRDFPLVFFIDCSCDKNVPQELSRNCYMIWLFGWYFLDIA